MSGKVQKVTNYLVAGTAPPENETGDLPSASLLSVLWREFPDHLLRILIFPQADKL